MVPLSFLPEGGTAVIVDFYGGRNMITRLMAMGLTVGTKIRIVKSTGPGPVLIEVRGTRLALGRGVATKILVKEV